MTTTGLMSALVIIVVLQAAASPVTGLQCADCYNCDHFTTFTRNTTCEAGPEGMCVTKITRLGNIIVASARICKRKGSQINDLATCAARSDSPFEKRQCCNDHDMCNAPKPQPEPTAVVSQGETPGLKCVYCVDCDSSNGTPNSTCDAGPAGMCVTAVKAVQKELRLEGKTTTDRGCLPENPTVTDPAKCASLFDRPRVIKLQCCNDKDMCNQPKPEPTTVLPQEKNTESLPVTNPPGQDKETDQPSESGLHCALCQTCDGSTYSTCDAGPGGLCMTVIRPYGTDRGCLRKDSWSGGDLATCRARTSEILQWHCCNDQSMCNLPEPEPPTVIPPAKTTESSPVTSQPGQVPETDQPSKSESSPVTSQPGQEPETDQPSMSESSPVTSQPGQEPETDQPSKSENSPVPSQPGLNPETDQPSESGLQCALCTDSDSTTYTTCDAGPGGMCVTLVMPQATARLCHTKDQVKFIGDPTKCTNLSDMNVQMYCCNDENMCNLRKPEPSPFIHPLNSNAGSAVTSQPGPETKADLPSEPESLPATSKPGPQPDLPSEPDNSRRHDFTVEGSAVYKSNGLGILGILPGFGGEESQVYRVDMNVEGSVIIQTLMDGQKADE